MRTWGERLLTAAFLAAGLVGAGSALYGGTLYVAEESINSLNMYNEETGQFLGTLVGPNAAVIPGGIPYGMFATDAGYLFSADAGGSQVLEFYRGAFVQAIGVPASSFSLDPQGVALGPAGNLVVTNFSGQILSFEFGNGYNAVPTSSSLYSNIPGARAGALFNAAG